MEFDLHINHAGADAGPKLAETHFHRHSSPDPHMLHHFMVRLQPKVPLERVSVSSSSSHLRDQLHSMQDQEMRTLQIAGSKRELRASGTIGHMHKVPIDDSRTICLSQYLPNTAVVIVLWPTARLD